MNATDQQEDSVNQATATPRSLDSYFLLYALWGLLPTSIALFRLGQTDGDTRYIQVVSCLWWAGLACHLFHARLAFVLSGIAILACWIPVVNQVVGRVYFLWHQAPQLDTETWAPGLLLVNSIIEWGIWLVPTTALLLLWSRAVRDAFSIRSWFGTSNRSS